MQEGSRRAVLAALFANLGIAIAKLVAFLFTGASSMAAEAVHSVADTCNQALLLLGGQRAQQEPSPAHPFGYGRERYFWAFVVAVVLFALGSLFALYEGVSKLRDPHSLHSLSWAVGVLLLAIVFEGAALWNALREAERVRGDASWWQFIRHAKSPELPVVLLEDTGALLGLVFALAGVGLAAFTGDARFDALGSIAIGLLLGAIAIVLAAEMKSLLIGEAARPGTREEIARIIEAHPAVRSLLHLRTQHLGPEELLVAAKLQLEPDLSIARLTAAIDEIEAQLRARVPAARVTYLQPDTPDVSDAVGS
jgi:cation diffusion facilitator family transporter